MNIATATSLFQFLQCSFHRLLLLVGWQNVFAIRDLDVQLSLDNAPFFILLTMYRDLKIPDQQLGVKLGGNKCMACYLFS